MITTRHIKRFFEFSSSDRLELVLIGLRVPFYQLALKALGYQRFQRLFINSRTGQKMPGSIEHAKRQGRLVNMAVGGMIGGDKCLLRSVMLARHLTKTGYAPKIKLGVGKENSDFQAHSWVEVDGIVVNDRDGIAESHSIFEASK